MGKIIRFPEDNSYMMFAHIYHKPAPLAYPLNGRTRKDDSLVYTFNQSNTTDRRISMTGLSLKELSATINQLHFLSETLKKHHIPNSMDCRESCGRGEPVMTFQMVVKNTKRCVDTRVALNNNYIETPERNEIPENVNGEVIRRNILPTNADGEPSRGNPVPDNASDDLSRRNMVLGYVNDEQNRRNIIPRNVYNKSYRRNRIHNYTKSYRRNRVHNYNKLYRRNRVHNNNNRKSSRRNVVLDCVCSDCGEPFRSNPVRDYVYGEIGEPSRRSVVLDSVSDEPSGWNANGHSESSVRNIIPRNVNNESYKINPIPDYKNCEPFRGNPVHDYVYGVPSGGNLLPENPTRDRRNIIPKNFYNDSHKRNRVHNYNNGDSSSRNMVFDSIYGEPPRWNANRHGESSIRNIISGNVYNELYRINPIFNGEPSGGNVLRENATEVTPYQFRQIPDNTNGEPSGGNMPCQNATEETPSQFR